MIIYSVIAILAVLFAINLGGGNFGASFAAAYGGRILSKRISQFLFILFVFLGAVSLGRPVAETLGDKIIDPELFNANVVALILASATLNLYLSNLLHVPQSTSLVTVASIAGAGFYFKGLHVKAFFYLVPFWILLPLAGYMITYFVGRLVYPPRKGNFWIYEKLVNHGERLKLFVIIASCYNAFSVGANNVANAVGPLAGANIVNAGIGLALIAPFFGLGSFVFHGPLENTGVKIVPLGLLTASITCFVAGTLMILASLLGIPQSFVMIKVASVLAISGLKNGHKLTFSNPATKKTYVAWLVAPVSAFVITYILVWGFYAFSK